MTTLQTLKEARRTAQARADVAEAQYLLALAEDQGPDAYCGAVNDLAAAQDDLLEADRNLRAWYEVATDELRAARSE